MAKFKYVVFFIIFNIVYLLSFYLIKGTIRTGDIITSAVAGLVVAAIIYYKNEKKPEKKTLDSES